MKNVIEQGQRLIKRAEKHNAIAARALTALHELAAQAIKDHGAKVGLDEPQIAALVIPKEPREPE